MKVHSVWWATALASKVFPVPGGPYSNTPYTSQKQNVHVYMFIGNLPYTDTYNYLNISKTPYTSIYMTVSFLIYTKQFLILSWDIPYS